SLRKGDIVDIDGYSIKEGKTSPPKRYTSGSMILAMENAGQLIEDEELRAQIKGAGIGTSATRAGIIEKLVKTSYLNLNKKTQVLTPTVMGEMIYEIVLMTLPSMLEPKMTASWEKGLAQLERGEITTGDYRTKLDAYVSRYVNMIKSKDLTREVAARLSYVKQFEKAGSKKRSDKQEKKSSKGE
ncbi:MAG: DNA topoisomerase III, partial [Lachnospiraceae bacterium]|nr:DNA topoisomerase III [Lachnospiraceae bacterium]